MTKKILNLHMSRKSTAKIYYFIVNNIYLPNRKV